MANWVRYPLPDTLPDTPSPFLIVSFLESMRSGGAIPPPPPPQKGYLSDTCTIPYENKPRGCIPLFDTTSKRYCAIWGGISHWAAKAERRCYSVSATAQQRMERGAWHLKMEKGGLSVPPERVSERILRHLCAWRTFRIFFHFFPSGAGKTLSWEEPWINTRVGGNFRRTCRTIGPYEISPGKGMDQ